MNPKSFNVKVHSESASIAKISLAASCGNSDYDIHIGYLDTLEGKVNLIRRVPMTYFSRIAPACESYLEGWG